MSPPSKSGTIGQALGLLRARFVANINTGAKFLKQPDPKTIDEWQSLSDDIHESKEKLSSNIESIVLRDQKWQDLILDLPPDEVGPEEQLYGSTAADPKTGYLVEVEYAKDLICQLNKKLLSVNRHLAAGTAAANAVATTAAAAVSTATTNPTPATKLTAKLPKLTLPVFSGDYLEWQNFWSIFTTNVDSQAISDAEKFAYLKMQLESVAATTIGGLIVNNDNYAVAVKLLKERFQRSQPQLISSLYSQLKKLPVSANKLNELIATYDHCEKILRQLENVGEDVNANRSLVLEVLGKYPAPIIKDLLRHHKTGSHSTLSEVRAGMRLLIQQTEDLAGVMDDLNLASTEKDTTRSARSSNDFRKVPETESKPLKSSAFAAATAGTTKSGQGSATPQKPCYFCEEMHFNSQCDKYRTLSERQARGREIGRCLRCLSPKHLQPACTVPDEKVRYFFCKPTGGHVSPLCPVQFGKATSGGTQKAPAAQALLSSAGQSVLPTASTVAVNPDRSSSSIDVRILFDTGSHKSYVTDECAARLGLVGGTTEHTEIAVFGTERTLSVSSQLVYIDILQQDATYRQLSAHTIPVITNSPIHPSTLSADDQRFMHSLPGGLADKPPGENSGNIDILMGSDYFWEFLTGAKVVAPSGLNIIPSTLGMLVCGRYGSDESPAMHQATLLCLTETFGQFPITNGLVAVKSARVPEYPDIDGFWSLESIGIQDDPSVKDDDEALRLFNSSIQFDGQRYQARWPWKPSVNNLPSNYDLALRRFRSLAKRLQSSDPELLQKYQNIIDDQQKKGVIEKVKCGEHHDSGSVLHYLPHHPIIKPSSETTKVRIVYDASAKMSKDNPLLNECLYRGPVLLPDLCAMLIRFCCHPIGILADVEKAFLQVGLQPTERDATRFLWFEDVGKPMTDDNIVIYRFCRVLFGIICSPFLLAATIMYHLNQHNDCVAIDLKKNTYVDNVVSGTPSDDSAIQYQRRAKKLFHEAGMNLQQWCSNSNMLMDTIPDCDKASKPVVKVLGIMWNCRDDMLQLINPSYVGFSCGVSTKRGLLQCLASVFDPLGWFQPVLLPAKLLLQRLWENKHAWDDELPQNLQSEAVAVLSEIKQLFEIRLPRHPFPSASMSFSIVAFSDASAAAYAAVVYLRQLNNVSGEVATRLMFSKCRLAPRKPVITLPRLELLGAVIAARAARFVRDAISPISDAQPIQVYLFTDSQCVLHWLTTPKPLSVFVSNRIKELRQMTDAEYIYVASNDNPADFSTRGMATSDLKTSQMWWYGPHWLCHDRDEWPKHNIDSMTSADIADAVTAELKKSAPVFQSLLAQEGREKHANVTPFGIDLDNYSSFIKLLRVTVFCMKFLRMIMWNAQSEDIKARLPLLQRMFDEVKSQISVTRSELNVAKVLWMRSAQQNHYSDVAECVNQGRHHSLIKQLNIKADDWGLLRCHGRLEHIDAPSSAAHPILVPKQSRLAVLILRELHEKMFHAGVGHTLSESRREYWIPKGRTATRTVVTRCVICRKHRGSSFALPNMPPWPRERLSRSNPFQFTGLDYLGPINVNVGGETKKMWVCLFTCLAVRAVHLEYVMDCTAKQFLDCLIRFVSRRGTPEQVISDNAPQFRTVKTAFDKIWHSILNDDTLLTYTAEKGIVWKFTTELAPWQGGFYERLVGVVKRAMKVVVGRRLLEFSEFVTLCSEVEAIVNSRPITYVYGDFDSRFALRPTDFLTDLPVGMPSTGVELTPKQMGEAGGNLVRYWKSKNARLDTLWRFWQDEYLLSLRERGGMQHKGKRGELKSSPQLGQVVLLKDPGLPRGSWKLARIIRLVPSADGTVRSVELLLPNRQVLKRAVNFIYPLEIDQQTTDDGDEPDFDGFDEEEGRNAEERVNRLSSSKNPDVRDSMDNGLTTTAMTLAFIAVCPNHASK